jgi:hypothetical protein
LRQREIVDELERHGRGGSPTTKLARELLTSFEIALSAHLNDRAHLLLALDEMLYPHGEPPLSTTLVSRGH